MKFILMSHHRSGSTMLMDMLKQLPGFVMYDELFIMADSRPDTFRSWLGCVPAGMYLTNYIYNIADPEPNKKVHEFLDDIYGLSDCGKTVGFKLMYNQFLSFKEAIQSYLAANDIYIIHLIRNNIIKGVLSAKYKREPLASMYLPDEVLRRQMGLRDKNKMVRKFTIKPEKMLPFMRKREYNIALFKDMFKDYPHCLTIVYEDITNNGENLRALSVTHVNRILNFLNCGYTVQKGIKARKRKAAPPKISQYIDNYVELADYLQKHAPEYVKYLD